MATSDNSHRKFVPELHDIGKLVDDSLKDSIGLRTSRGRKHTFEQFNFGNYALAKPSSPSWFGQFHHIWYDIISDSWVDECPKGHDCKKIDQIEIDMWNIIPKKFRRNLFILIIADHLASSVSRATIELGRGHTQEGILKLWNRSYYDAQKKKGKSLIAFKNINDLKILFDEIENCRSGEEFLSKYKEHLLLTPEDKSVPRNVTSLYTHAELVGKIYRVLEKNTRVITEPDSTIAIEYNGIKVKTIKEAEGDGFIYFKDRSGREHCGNKGRWQARLVKCWIKFPHSFVRLHDINLLRKREELVNCIASYYKEEAIFATSDFITLFLPPNQDLKEILKPFLDWGFYIEVEETLADLGILNSILDRKTLRARESNEQPRLNVLNSRGTKMYRRYLMPETSDEIQPHICDICQQRRGVERIKETIREWICEKCQEIRDMGEPFREYATVWEKEGVRVCWFKFYLDQSKLETWLQNAFEEYVDGYNFRQADILKDEFRPLALQVDFNKDYKEMLKEFWKEFSGIEDIKKPIAEYDELGVFKYSPELTKMIIEKFLNLFEQYFPDCASDKSSPISLSLSIANIKYPIKEHWRFFEKNCKKFLNVRYHKVFNEKYTKDELKVIIEKAIDVKASSSFLHKLVQLEESLRSEIHITVEILNNRKKHPEIYELFSKGIKPSKFLNLYRLLKGGEW